MAYIGDFVWHIECIDAWPHSLGISRFRFFMTYESPWTQLLSSLRGQCYQISMFFENSPLCRMGEEAMAIRSQQSPLQNRERSLWPYDHISPLCRMGEGGYDHMVTIVPSAEWERRLWFFWAWIWPFVQLEFWLKGTEMANRYHFWPKTRQLTGCWSIQSWQYTSLVYSDKRGIHI